MVASPEKSRHLGGMYGSGVPGEIGGYFFSL
jgi:hypothetical protein